ncbi:hypothetical protein RRF57_013356 [Xylaria bambusicola]|uniref:Uncharacterized protein n=1 Tax=Xylaria bambusicola TaxID=326684 RepID=A0AAN7ZEA0_9PEZI
MAMPQFAKQQAQPLLEPSNQINVSQANNYQMADLAGEGSINSLMGEPPGGTSSTLTLPYHARNRPSLLTRLGAFVVIANALTFTTLVISISIISWLWFGNEKDDKRRQVLLGDHLDEIITTSSIFIRAAVTTQTTTVIAMLSSLAMECSGGVQLKEVPAISIARYSNAGPLSMLLHFVS